MSYSLYYCPPSLTYRFAHCPQFTSASGSNTTRLIINAVGQDRLGIVADITGKVIQAGGNVGESQAAKLGTHFSLMMLVDVPQAKLDDLKATLHSLEDMNAAVFETQEQVQAAFHPKVACEFEKKSWSCVVNCSYGVYDGGTLSFLLLFSSVAEWNTSNPKMQNIRYHLTWAHPEGGFPGVSCVPACLS